MKHARAAGGGPPQSIWIIEDMPYSARGGRSFASPGDAKPLSFSVGRADRTLVLERRPTVWTRIHRWLRGEDLDLVDSWWYEASPETTVVGDDRWHRYEREVAR